MRSEITNAALAQKISDLIDMWRTRELQMSAWISGPAGGGDNSNGTYPLSDYLGTVTYQPSPAQLASGVVGPVADSTAQAVASAASAVVASSAKTAAQTARDLALSYQTGAQAARDLALSYSNLAADAAANATASDSSSSTSAGAAATSESNAAASATTAAASASSAGASVAAAASSASTAAAAATAAATFNPALYRLKSVAIADADITGLAWSKLTGNPADIRSVGQIRATGWFNTPSTDPNGLGMEIGESGGQAYMLAYNRTSSSYGVMNLQGSLINLLSQTTINTGTIQPLELVTSSPGPWALALTRSDLSNSVKVYNSGSTWTFSNTVAAPLVTSSGDIYASGGYRWGQDTTFWIYNTSGYNYGSWRIGGARGSYAGLVLDVGNLPTFMSNGSATGVYLQGASRWSWYDDGARFHTTLPIFVDNYNGCVLTFTGGQTSGKVTVQNGGSPAGTAEGDITLIW